MIHITGDTHGVQNRILSIEQRAKAKSGDILIICGDFGFVFEDSYTEKMFLNDLENRPYTYCFVDGNHENFPAIFKYPVEDWHGGKVHRIRNNIFHLMRGEVFNIENKTFFALGGAYSIDRYMRKKNVSYWEEEIPNNDEYRNATESLRKYNNKIDYILTHTAPRELIRRMGYYPDPHDMELTGFLEYIMYNVEYKGWFFGHWHEDRTIDSRHRALFYDVIEV